jgi:hypothetical protein
MKKRTKPKTDFEIKTRASFLLHEYKKQVKYPNHERQIDNQKYVYLFRNPLSKLCKIGVTTNPRERLRQLQRASGLEIQSLIVIELEQDYDEASYFIENFLHNYFYESRTFGEWFDLNIKDILAIKNLFWSIDGDYIWDNIKAYLLSNKYEKHYLYTP